MQTPLDYYFFASSMLSSVLQFLVGHRLTTTPILMDLK